MMLAFGIGVTIAVGILSFALGTVFGAWIYYELETAPVFNDPDAPDLNEPVAT